MLCSSKKENMVFSWTRSKADKTPKNYLGKHYEPGEEARGFKIGPLTSRGNGEMAGKINK